MHFWALSNGVDAPTASCAKVGVSSTYGQEASMEEVSAIRLDVATSVFQAHGADAAGHQLFDQWVFPISASS